MIAATIPAKARVATTPLLWGGGWAVSTGSTVLMGEVLGLVFGVRRLCIVHAVCNVHMPKPRGPPRGRMKAQ
ncbi:hypothetical protein GA0115252_13395 [Streptomyces sp. DfronAA-171]|nr:hypothetical protein GA0115252_13395 [Streptomyces sp. DfronAA-171]